MLVTCIDSSPRPARLDKWLEILIESGVRHEVLCDFVWIPGSDVARVLSSKNIFFGFDEIYFLKGSPSGIPVLIVRFTSDGASFADGLPDSLASNMTDFGADRYLADGCGLNFAIDSQSAKFVFEPTPTPPPNAPGARLPFPR
jgi:hypothetical protein